METNVNYTLIGLFVVIFTAALIGGVLWLGADIQAREYKTYRVYVTESVSGLSEGAQVLYRGVDVGIVREISLDSRHPQRVSLLLDIASDIVVRENDSARLETSGVTGLYYINVTGGTPNAPPVRARKGAQYPVIESSPSFLGRLDMALSAMSKNLIVTSNKLNDMLNDDNRRSYARILDNVEAATGSLAAGKLDAAVDDLAASMRNARVASERLPGILGRIESGVAAIEEAATQFSTTAGDLDRVVTASGGDVGRFTAQALPEATATIAELRLAVENLRRLSEELARDPSTIIYGSPQPRLGPGE
jgi:phospholipid/cholesterol/gamma-HCH transport system substrate-binding protein